VCGHRSGEALDQQVGDGGNRFFRLDRPVKPLRRGVALAGQVGNRHRVARSSRLRPAVRNKSSGSPSFLSSSVSADDNRPALLSAFMRRMSAFRA
jgi:hypothetical protein